MSILFAVTLHLLSDKETSVKNKERKLSEREVSRLKRKIARFPSQVHSLGSSNQKLKKEASKYIKRPSLSFKRNTQKVIRGRRKKVLRSPGSKIVDGFGYNFLENFFAVVDTPENRQKFPNAKLKLNHLIVNGAGQGLPVVQNKDTGFVGIFTYTVIVKLNSQRQDDFYKKIENLSFTFKEKLEHLDLFHLEFADKNATVAAYSLLKNEDFVKRISMEVLEYSRSAR